MNKVVLAVVFIVALVAMFVLVSADFQGCHCQFVTGCEFDENGVGYRYYYCGNCDAYSTWKVDWRCVQSNVS